MRYCVGVVISRTRKKREQAMNIGCRKDACPLQLFMVNKELGSVTKQPHHFESVE